MSSQNVNQQAFDARFSRNYPAYPRDEVHSIHPTHNYEGKVTKSETIIVSPFNSSVSNRVIDDAISIQSVDEKTRQLSLDYFNSNKEQATVEKKKYKYELLSGVAGTIIGAGVGIGGLVLTGPLSIPIAFTGGFIAMMGIWQSVHSGNAMDAIEGDINEIEKQKNQWQDPIHRVSEQRRLVGINGFSYVFENRLKDTIVHPEEVEALWVRDFSKLLNQHQNTEKVFSEDLLGKERMGYAWGDVSIADLKVLENMIPAAQLNTMIDQYRECKQAYQTFSNLISRETESLRKEQQRLNQGISEQRSQWLLPASYLHTQGRQEATYLYRNAMEPFIREKNLAIENVERAYLYVVRNPLDQDEVAYKSELDRLRRKAVDTICHEFQTNPAVITIEQAYVRDHRMCDFLYQQSKLVVDSFFDQRIRQLNLAVNRAQESINEQRMNGLQHFNHLLHKILTPHHQAAAININISVPYVQRNWRLPDYIQEPSWNDIYGHYPRFQSQFGSDISSDAWEMFWGCNGLGRYASAPRDSWTHLFADGNAFPFKQRWFNLHTIPQPPRSGIFCQRVVVPQPPQRIFEQKCRTETTTRTSHGFGGTTRRKETPQENNKDRVIVGERRAAHGFGGTTSREETPQENDKERVIVGERKTAHGFGGTTSREETPQDKKKERDIVGETRTAHGFGGTRNR